MAEKSYKLYYFPHMGREEIARVMFACAGIKYEDIRIPYDEWPSKKATMPFEQLPVLEVDDTVICQSGAIVRYVAKQCGFNGKTDIEEAKADMITECVFDIMMRFPWTEQDEKRKKEVLQDILHNSIPKSLKKLEAMLLKEGGEYFTGQFSYADIALMNGGQYLLEQRSDILDGTPKLKAHLHKIETMPTVAKWIAIRPGGN